MQSIWSSGLYWDKTLPEDSEIWYDEILLISNLFIPSHYVFKIPDVEIHSFSYTFFLIQALRHLTQLPIFELRLLIKEFEQHLWPPRLE